MFVSNFSSFPQYFQYISNFRSQITYSFVKIYFSSLPQHRYVEVRISRSVSESPLEFEITRVDCRWKVRQTESPYCSCGEYETVQHFILDCEKYEEAKMHLLQNLQVELGITAFHIHTLQEHRTAGQYTPFYHFTRVPHLYTWTKA